MFRSACEKNRGSIYGVRAYTQLKRNLVSNSTGSGFTIAPGMLITAAHLIHVENDFGRPAHEHFEVIRSPDIGSTLETTTLVAEDPVSDIALLKISNPRSLEFLSLEHERMPTGTNCGSLGFPLSEVVTTPEGTQFNLVERFQGSFISSFIKRPSPKGAIVDYYEVDTEMYTGSSGCPGFLTDSKVVGMQSQSIYLNTTRIGKNSDQLAISLWVPSMDIIAFAEKNGIIV